ncbi:DMT family transporter [Brevibacillus migulae]|uniref:DMT family transporter n=1 Tax=Brevibacillus migulae TaxID=1644114 RepID=UPI00106EBD5D|nr:multidrug resistance efflux transporter family protein [Brevibacillus migulae]
MKLILLGILSAFFFTFTFVLNRAMDLSGGSWMWSASLRYFFMIPFLLVIVGMRRNMPQLLAEMKANWREWLLWSFVGFGLFYGPICFAAAYGPGWLIAGTWQITIVAGTLLVPFFYEEIQSEKGTVRVRQQIPMKGLLMSLVILLGVILMQLHEARDLAAQEILYGVIPMVVAAFAYPLGNRKMMVVTQGRLDAFQRLLGMTLASMPCWILLAIYSLAAEGPPSVEQAGQSLIVAVSSGVIATALFFRATDLAKGNPQKLAAVEATQAGEVLFAVLLESLLLAGNLPSLWAFMGMGLVIVGMVLHSYVSHGFHKKAEVEQELSAP